MPDMKLPMFVVGAERDHIAPWHSVFKLHHQNDGELTFVLTSGGHNAGIISEPGHPRRHFRIRVRPAAARSVRMNGSATRRPKMGPGGWSGMHGSTGILAGASIRHRWARPASCRSATLQAPTCWKDKHHAGVYQRLNRLRVRNRDLVQNPFVGTPSRRRLRSRIYLTRINCPALAVLYSVVFVIVCRPRAGTMNRLNLCRR
jgi:hypothetical protein